jgi:hypothetical protein
MKKINQILQFTLLTILILTCKSDSKKSFLGLLALLPSGNSISNAPTVAPGTSTPANPDDTAFANGTTNTGSTEYDFITYGTPVSNPPVVPTPPVVPNPLDEYSLSYPPFVAGNVSARLLKPLNGSDRFQDLVIEFSEPMDTSSICAEAATVNNLLKKNSGAYVETICYWKTTSQLFLDILQPLEGFEYYRVTMPSSAKSLTNLLFTSFTIASLPITTTLFKTEPLFSMTNTIKQGVGPTYTVDNNQGTNIDEANPATPTTVMLTTNFPDIQKASNVYLYNLRNVGVRHTICSANCNSFPTSFQINLNSGGIPNDFKLNSNNVGAQQFYYQIEYQISATPLQFKRYYRTFNFNWGTHSLNPDGPQLNTAKLVLEAGRNGREGTLNVLGKFLNEFADRRFQIKSYNSSNIVREEFLYDVMRRNLSSLNDYSPSAASPSTGCLGWAFSNQRWVSKFANGYFNNDPLKGPTYPKTEGTAYSPFQYYTDIGPFCGVGYTVPSMSLNGLCVKIGAAQLCGDDIPGMSFSLGYTANIYINEAVIGFDTTNPDWIDNPPLVNPSGNPLIDPSTGLPYSDKLYRFRNLSRVKDAVHHQAGAVRVGLDLIPPTPSFPISTPSDYNLKVTMDVQKMRAGLTAVLFVDDLFVDYTLDFGFFKKTFTVNLLSAIPTITVTAHLDANLDKGAGYSLTNMHAKVKVVGGKLVLEMYNFVAGSMSSIDTDKFYAPSWDSDLKILSPSALEGIFSLTSGSQTPPQTCYPIKWVNYSGYSATPSDPNSGQYRDVANDKPTPNPPPRNVIPSANESSYPGYINWANFNYTQIPVTGPSTVIVYKQPTKICVSEEPDGVDPDANGFLTWFLSPLRQVVDNAVKMIVPEVKKKLITQMLRNFVETVASDIFNAVLDPVGKGVVMEMPPLLPVPIGSSTDSLNANEGMKLKLGVEFANSSTNIAKQDPNGAKGLETSGNMTLLLSNKNLTGPTYSPTGAIKSCSLIDSNSGKCPNGIQGTQSFIKTKDPNLELPYILSLEQAKPGVMLGLHSDAIGQFFHSFWKEGGLNMKINQTFINRLLAYRTKTRPIELLEVLLKGQSILQVLSPGRTTMIVKNSLNQMITMNGSDNIEIRLRPLQTPFVYMNGPANSYPAPSEPANYYIPKLGISLSDVEVELVGNPGPAEYRIAVARLNIKTNARLWTAPYSNPSDPIYGSRLSVKLDICNDFDDAFYDSLIGNKDCDYDLPNVNQFGNHNIRPESKDLTYSVVVYEDQIRNPLSLSANNIVELINPIVGTVLIPVFNFVLGEIPLPALTHCGINIANNINIVGIPNTFIPTDPSKKPMFLLNGLSSASYTGFFPIGGTCDLTAPVTF